ncbi:MAG: peptidase [Bdellovibrionales bacterium]|nr:peptidase [Bdellovibrionales bacterium]
MESFVSSESSKKKQQIVIDEEKGLVFSSEKDLLDHFSADIKSLERSFLEWRSQSDFNEEESLKYENNLTDTLDEPDEVWIDDETLPGKTLTIFLKEFESEEEAEDRGLFHVAVTYMTGDIPSFIYLHFPTNDLHLVEKYQVGKLIYDRFIAQAPEGAIEGDALIEEDQLALGLYGAMLKVRVESDIPIERFIEYAQYREASIEDADEIWRSNDSMGNVLVSFVKDLADEGEKGVWYIVVTVEDAPSNSHALLFSFPTNDEGLVERYRHGENLQAEEVIQESSH